MKLTQTCKAENKSEINEFYDMPRKRHVSKGEAKALI